MIPSNTTDDSAKRGSGILQLANHETVVRVCIGVLFLAIIVLSNNTGEVSLIRNSISSVIGSPEPKIKEFASDPQNFADLLLTRDTISASSYNTINILVEDPIIILGDTIGGIANPSGELMEWVSEATEIITHTINAGETVSDIAKNYGVSIETILWANNLSASATIRPGNVLRFPSLSGVLHKVRSGETISSIATAYRADPDKIVAANPGIIDVLEVGDEIIVPGGRPQATRQVQAPATGSAQRVATAPTGQSGQFIMPAVGLNWGRLHPHNAIDIANVCGTPVWAAASGTVTRAARGWNGGYGNLIVISHPNGMQTYYAHLNSFLVQNGASVTQGQQIGTIGNTGNTHGPTGCHLHFEVRGGVNPFIRYR